MSNEKKDSPSTGSGQVISETEVPEQESEELKEETEGFVEANPSGLTATSPLQGRSLDAHAQQTHTAKQDLTVPPERTRGVRVSQSGAEHLRDAARRAARSGGRNDVHEYMRIRRSFV